MFLIRMAGVPFEALEKSGDFCGRTRGTETDRRRESESRTGESWKSNGSLAFDDTRFLE